MGGAIIVVVPIVVAVGELERANDVDRNHSMFSHALVSLPVDIMIRDRRRCPGGK